MAKRKSTNSKDTATVPARRELERQKALLDAAERAFADKGLDGVRMADIARGAGVATGTIYNYFKNKDAVFQSLVALRGSQFVSGLRQAFEGEARPLERLLDMIQFSLEHLEEHRGTFAVFMELGATSESGIRRSGGVRAERLYQECVSLMEEAIQGGIASGAIPKQVPSAELVSFLLGSLNGLVNAWVVGRIHGSLSGRGRTLYQFFLRGAGASP